MRRPTALIILVVLALAGCRGMESDNPPIHPNLNMDFQNRFDPQEANSFFEDNRSMRPIVPGTIARGTLREDVVFYEGRAEDGSYVEQMPLPTTRELLARGQERYDIYCTPCHGAVGDGEGIITTGGYGYTPAPTYHSDRLRDVADGYLYDTIANGIRTMPAYGHQVPPADRWAIVAYVRALQRSQYASPSDVPAGIREDVQREAQDAAAGAEPPADETQAETDEGQTGATEADEGDVNGESGLQDGTDATATENG